jgi:hypothetical protein
MYKDYILKELEGLLPIPQNGAIRPYSDSFQQTCHEAISPECILISSFHLHHGSKHNCHIDSPPPLPKILDASVLPMFLPKKYGK